MRFDILKPKIIIPLLVVLILILVWIFYIKKTEGFSTQTYNYHYLIPIELNPSEIYQFNRLFNRYLILNNTRSNNYKSDFFINENNDEEFDQNLKVIDGDNYVLSYNPTLKISTLKKYNTELYNLYNLLVFNMINNNDTSNFKVSVLNNPLKFAMEYFTPSIFLNKRWIPELGMFKNTSTNELNDTKFDDSFKLINYILVSSDKELTFKNNIEQKYFSNYQIHEDKSDYFTDQLMNNKILLLTNLNVINRINQTETHLKDISEFNLNNTKQYYLTFAQLSFNVNNIDLTNISNKTEFQNKIKYYVNELLTTSNFSDKSLQHALNHIYIPSKTDLSTLINDLNNHSETYNIAMDENINLEIPYLLSTIENNRLTIYDFNDTLNVGSFSDNNQNNSSGIISEMINTSTSGFIPFNIPLLLEFNTYYNNSYSDSSQTDNFSTSNDMQILTGIDFLYLNDYYANFIDIGTLPLFISKNDDKSILPYYLVKLNDSSISNQSHTFIINDLNIENIDNFKNNLSYNAKNNIEHFNSISTPLTDSYKLNLLKKYFNHMFNIPLPNKSIYYNISNDLLILFNYLQYTVNEEFSDVNNRDMIVLQNLDKIITKDSPDSAYKNSFFYEYNNNDLGFLVSSLSMLKFIFISEIIKSVIITYIPNDNTENYTMVLSNFMDDNNLSNFDDFYTEIRQILLTKIENSTTTTTTTTVPTTTTTTTTAGSTTVLTTASSTTVPTTPSSTTVPTTAGSTTTVPTTTASGGTTTTIPVSTGPVTTKSNSSDNPEGIINDDIYGPIPGSYYIPHYSVFDENNNDMVLELAKSTYGTPYLNEKNGKIIGNDTASDINVNNFSGILNIFYPKINSS